MTSPEPPPHGTGQSVPRIWNYTAVRHEEDIEEPINKKGENQINPVCRKCNSIYKKSYQLRGARYKMTQKSALYQYGMYNMKILKLTPRKIKNCNGVSSHSS